MAGLRLGGYSLVSSSSRWPTLRIELLLLHLPRQRGPRRRGCMFSHASLHAISPASACMHRSLRAEAAGRNYFLTRYIYKCCAGPIGNNFGTIGHCMKHSTCRVWLWAYVRTLWNLDQNGIHFSMAVPDKARFSTTDERPCSLRNTVCYASTMQILS
jgi:hypothetical protein